MHIFFFSKLMLKQLVKIRHIYSLGYFTRCFIQQFGLDVHAECLAVLTPKQMPSFRLCSMLDLLLAQRVYGNIHHLSAVCSMIVS